MPDGRYALPEARPAEGGVQSVHQALDVLETLAAAGGTASLRDLAAGLLCVWLAALADVVPADAPPWLREAGQHWREQASTGFSGCVDAALDTLLATRQRAQSILALTDAASGQLASLTDAAGYLPASWLNNRHISGDVDWTSRNVQHDYVQQIKDAFAPWYEGNC